MVTEDFFTEIEGIINRRTIVSRGAQNNGERIVSQVIGGDLERYVGYRLLCLPRAAKTRQRLLEKARRIKEKNPEFAAPQVATEIKDIAGCRILAIGISDVQFVHDYFCQRIRELPLRDLCKMAGNPTVFLESPKAGGFRGLIQDTEIIMDDKSFFPFELQIMTYLQHSWDQLQHGIYELKRKGLGTDPSVDKTFEEKSKQLYEIDKQIDELKRNL